MMRSITAAVVGFANFVMPALAQSDQPHSNHKPVVRGAVPLESGQGAFAALAEIAAILTSDPGTDWSQVDLGALHRHLLDMDALITRAEVSEVRRSDGLRVTVRRIGTGGEAAMRMVPAHSPMLEAETGWRADVRVGQDHIVWTVSAVSAADAVKIQALGFFGLMATGAHHQSHHLAIARGRMPH